MDVSSTLNTFFIKPDRLATRDQTIDSNYLFAVYRLNIYAYKTTGCVYVVYRLCPPLEVWKNHVGYSNGSKTGFDKTSRLVPRLWIEKISRLGSGTNIEQIEG